MTRVDCPAYTAWPGHPSWVVRRLRRLHIRFALGNSMPGMSAVRRIYASFNYGDGRYLSQRHLELFGHAWLSVGPHVQAPPLDRVPCIIYFLSALRREDSLLEGWLLSLAGDTLRHHPWVEDMEDLSTLGTLLRRGQIRRYWEWLTDVIQSHCAQITCVNGDWQRHVVASRVASALYSGCGLSSLVHRVEAWHRFSVPLNDADHRFLTSDELIERARPCPLLDPSMGVVRGNFHVQHLTTLPALVAEGNDMNNCAGRLLDQVEARLILVFSLRDRNSGSRATGTVVVDENGLWKIGELNGPRNQALVATDVRHQAMRNLCFELAAIGKRHPRVAECLMARTLSKRRRELHAQRTGADGRIQQFVPGIGSRDPAQVIQRLWIRCANQ